MWGQSPSIEDTELNITALSPVLLLGRPLTLRVAREETGGSSVVVVGTVSVLSKWDSLSLPVDCDRGHPSTLPIEFLKTLHA